MSRAAGNVAGGLGFDGPGLISQTNCKISERIKSSGGTMRRAAESAALRSMIDHPNHNKSITVATRFKA
jgi:hypothetical protein